MFDNTTRNRLAAFVSSARRLLCGDYNNPGGEITAILQSYGIQPDGSVTTLDDVPDLDQRGYELGQTLRDVLDHKRANAVSLKAWGKYDPHVYDLIQEQAFTVLNRLCALRMTEERGILPYPVVSKGLNSESFELYEQVTDKKLLTRDERYAAFLFSVFAELSLDLGVLFDRFSPHGMLFPRPDALGELLALINDQELAPLWAEDETIGWIYQYWNSKEERKAMRDASATPRNSRELAVRNQFFTPRYVVEFLTDNTLGLIWYEMTKGETRLARQCRYLVRRPTEIFLGEGEDTPDSSEGDTDETLSQEELLKQPVHIPHRPVKDPREIRLLDPACGSMHFGLYAFDLFEAIYEEAWEKQLSVVGGQWSDNPDEQAEILSRVGGLAKSDGSSGSNLPSDQVLSERGGLRADKPDPAGGDLHPIEHRGGTRQNLDQGVSAASVDRLRLADGNRDPDPDLSTPGLSEPGPSGRPDRADLRDREDVERALIVALEQANWTLTTDHRPLILDFQNKAELLKAVPKLIIEHNIHGVDIDARAVQIAGLSLWLRAQKSWRDTPAAERPRVRRSNIVCAERMPGSDAMLEDFVGTLDPPLLGELVKTVFDKMQLAGEAGTLLKIEEEIRTAIDDAKAKWEQLGAAERDLFSAEELNQTLRPGTQQELTGVEKALTTDRRPLATDFFDTAEERIYAALRDYAESAEAGDYQRRLFAEDAAHGFAFIDLCRKRYDAVVMNPPFGEPTLNSKPLIFSNYEISKFDVAAAFAYRAAALGNAQALVGSLTNRTIFFGQMLAGWRTHQFIENGSLETFGDLGVGVLDSALVEAVAYTFSNTPAQRLSLFFKRTGDDRRIDECMKSIREGEIPEDVFLSIVSAFSRIPGFPFAYWTSLAWLSAFASLEPLEDYGFRVKQGMESSDNFRFVRLWWEVPSAETDWKPYSKGGCFGPHWRDIDVVVNWGIDGHQVKAFSASKYGTWTKQITNSDFYERPGLCYPASRVEFSPRILPAGCIVGCKSPIIAHESPHKYQSRDYASLLAILTSSSFRALINLTTTSGDTMSKSYRERAVAEIPIPDPAEIPSTIADTALEIAQQLRELEGADETCRVFSQFCSEDDLQNLGSQIRNTREALDRKIAGVYGFRGPNYVAFDRTGYDDIQDALQDLQPDIPHYCVGAALGRWDIRYATGERQPPELPDPFDPLPDCPPGMLQNADGLPAASADVPDDYPLPITWPGILVSDPGHPEDIVARVRDALTVIWGDRSAAIEQEACEILGVRTLRDYFAEKKSGSKFFKDHLKRYSKSRRQAPIYWPLSTESGSYTLWIYYHRLTEDTLYACVTKFVIPKQEQVEKTLARLAAKGDARTQAEDKEYEQAEALIGELATFRAELERLAKIWKPNLNDGVQITAAPLWTLFRFKPWQTKLKATWKSLEKGEYDWAHLAHTLWPERVIKKCAEDRSLAIAHGYEEDLWEEIEDDKGKTKWQPKKDSADLVERLTADRT